MQTELPSQNVSTKTSEFFLTIVHIFFHMQDFTACIMDIPINWNAYYLPVSTSGKHVRAMYTPSNPTFI